MNGIGILTAIVVGILAGWIAEHVMHRRHGLMTNLVVGLIGALVGGVLASTLGVQFAGFWGSLIVSALGAIVLLAVLNMVRRRPIA
jgi:uncharacterized membrane protein YeaQ/YmgE (transglycosylase-associated protein family)